MSAVVGLPPVAQPISVIQIGVRRSLNRFMILRASLTALRASRGVVAYGWTATASKSPLALRR